MGFQLLFYFAKTGTAYLHPGGKRATAKLTKHLEIKGSMSVLEIGCGTGATLADLALIPDIKLTGVDISETMLDMAEERLSYCHKSKVVNLCLIKPDGKLPFADHTFDAAYAESILAIAETDTLPVLLKEIYRVLKPGARFIALDAIWKEGTKPDVIRRINQQCRKDFGIIQSLQQPATLKQWTDTFTQTGFSLILSQQITKADLLENEYQITNPLSDKFTKRKQLLSWVNPLLWYYRLLVVIRLKTRHRHDGAWLENCLFVMKKT